MVGTANISAESSENCLAQFYESKNYSVTKEMYKEFLIATVIPKTLDKLPCHHSQELFLQQNNGTSHRTLEDLDIIEACTGGRRKIDLINQHANSPYLRAWILGFLTFYSVY